MPRLFPNPSPALSAEYPANLLPKDILGEIHQIDELLHSVGSCLAQASELAELGAYSAMFAHEVNNLMTQVGGRAQLALMHMDRPEYVTRALELACHASSQIAQLSEIIMNSPANQQTPSPVSIIDIHQQALDFLSDDDIAMFGFSITDQGSAATFDLAPALLEQILLNLYLNAIRAIEESPNRSVGVVSTSVAINPVQNQCSTWNTPHQIEITVKDNGVGMSAQQLASLFERQASPNKQSGGGVKSTRNQGRGHGLGLAICQRFLTSANGSLCAQSTPGQGTKMMITIPCRIHQSTKQQAA